jgi:hypothetical protein
VNPSWRAIVDQNKKQETNKLYRDYKRRRLLDHKAGSFYNESMASSATKPDDIEKVLPFVWLLNMRSHYRDLNKAGL